METPNTTSQQKNPERDSTKRKKKRVLEALETTAIITHACKKAGVSNATFHRWMQVDHKFRKAAQEALFVGNEYMNDLAKSKIIESIAKGNTKDAQYWLNRRDPTFSGKPAPYSEPESRQEVDKETNRKIGRVFKWFADAARRSLKDLDEEAKADEEEEEKRSNRRDRTKE